MGRKPKNTIPKIHETFKILFKGGDDWDKLNESVEFKNIIYGEVCVAMNYAIKNKKAKINLFNLEDFGLTITAPKKTYKPMLEKTIKFYESQNNFEKCAELTKLKEQL